MTDPLSPHVSVSATSAARILLVDDDRILRTAIRFNLENAGYTVLDAEDATSALALAMQEAPIDLVVTDLMMPDMNGADLVRELRCRSRDLPAIVISGVTAADAHTHFVMPVNSVFLDKMMAPRLLLPTILTLLEPPIRPHLAAARESARELRV